MTPNNVAPRVGAWIETTNGTLYDCRTLMSHPVWVRGLKPYYPKMANAR